VSMSEATRFNCDGDFRLFLQKELDRRKKTNPKYSMRAFAGFLQIDVRRLSKYLRDERPMGVDFIEKAGARLMLTPEDITVFRSGAEARLAVASYQDTAKELAGYTQLSSEVFESIEHWRHYAILELMKVRSFQNDPQWIANALRISRKRGRPIHSAVAQSRLDRSPARRELAGRVRRQEPFRPRRI
jgi:transcriptional regulator with XRE-family HTH domain